MDVFEMQASILFMLCLVVCTKTHPKLSDKFGPFIPCFDNLVTCKGNKKHVLGRSYFSLNSVKSQSLYFNITLLADVVDPILRLRIFLWDGKQYKQMLYFNVKDVCKHELFKTVMIEPVAPMENVDGKCIVKKGTYVNPSVNLKRIAYKVTSGQFFYGRTKIQYMIYTRTSNVVCLTCECSSQRESC